MYRGRTVLLQDVAQLINIGRTHNLFYHEFLKTGLFLNYKETLGNFCSKIVNPVSHSLEVSLTELSSQLTNLHSDVNVRQNTSMDYLSSNFCQMNDFFTVKK